MAGSWTRVVEVGMPTDTQANHADELAVINWFERLLLTLVWMFVAGIPSALLLMFRVRAADELLVLLWWTGLAMTAGAYARALGHVFVARVPADPELRRSGLEHLPHACAVMLQEARSIRADIESTKVALERAWLLTQELERASPDVRVFVEACGARLDGVHPLLEAFARKGRRAPELARLRASLDAELAAFERALAEPQTRYR
jgi:hypothetical protein